MINKRKLYKIYPKEFKNEAVRMMKASDRSATEIARELGLRRNQLYEWAEQLETMGKKAFGDRGHPRKEDQGELSLLKSENEWLKGG